MDLLITYIEQLVSKGDAQQVPPLAANRAARSGRQPFVGLLSSG